MDPNSQNNPYEFIMNPQQPVRRNPFGGGFLLKVVLILGVGGLIGLGLYIFAVSSGGNANSNDTLLGIAQQQTELQRVAQGGTITARAQAVKNFGANTNLTIITNRADLVALLAKRGMKVEAKQLGLKRNPVTDQKLAIARDASEFDDAYVAELRTELTAYQSSVQNAYKGTDSQSEKQLMCGFYNQAAILLAMSAADPTAEIAKVKNSDEACKGDGPVVATPKS